MESKIQLFVLTTATEQGGREAIIADSAVWARAMPGVVERLVEVKGRMVDQETAHRWLDGRDIDLRDRERDYNYSQMLWNHYWGKHPVRTYKVPASSLAYVEELEDRSSNYGVYLDYGRGFADEGDSSPADEAEAA